MKLKAIKDTAPGQCVCIRPEQPHYIKQSLGMVLPHDNGEPMRVLMCTGLVILMYDHDRCVEVVSREMLAGVGGFVENSDVRVASKLADGHAFNGDRAAVGPFTNYLLTAMGYLTVPELDKAVHAVSDKKWADAERSAFDQHDDNDPAFERTLR